MSHTHTLRNGRSRISLGLGGLQMHGIVFDMKEHSRPMQVAFAQCILFVLWSDLFAHFNGLRRSSVSICPNFSGTLD